MKHAFSVLKRCRSLLTLLVAVPAVFTSPMLSALDKDGGWTPPSPADMPTRLDWVQLPSGEWLGGELIALYDDTLELDSEEMGVTQIDWDDVVEMRTAQVLRVRPDRGAAVTGQVMVKDGVVTVLDGKNTSFAKDHVLSATNGVPVEANYWSGDVFGSANFQSGNSENDRYNLRALLKRRTVDQRVTIEYIGNYDETDGQQTQNNQRLNFDLERFITDRLFWSPVFFEYYRDKFQNIQHRPTVGFKAGYEIIDSARTSWSVSSGPAFTQTWFEEVGDGEDDKKSSVALFGRSRFDFELTGDIDLWYDYRFLWASKDTGGYSHRMEVGSSYDVFGDLDVRLSYIWDYISNPIESDTGIEPKNTDTQLLLGVSYSF
jgi:hypothetical protein